MSKNHWPVMVNDADTPTLYVNQEGTMDLLSIERLDGGMVVISREEARRLAELLKSVVEEKDDESPK